MKEKTGKVPARINMIIRFIVKRAFAVKWIAVRT
jgi:hypothetical protein